MAVCLKDEEGHEAPKGKILYRQERGRKPIRKAAEVKILSLCDASSKASPSQILLPDLRLRLVRDGLNELYPGVAVSYCEDVANGGGLVAWKIS